MTFESLEQNARRAKEMSSFSDYKPGSATEEYRSYCQHAEEVAQAAKERLNNVGAPADRAEKVDYLLSLYKSKKLSWLNDLYANRARVPSVLVAGPANFPCRKKEKQNAREDTLMEQNPDYLLDKIRGIGRNSKTIYSDEKDAAERIKTKIESLKGSPDPYGNKAAEIRRLKERLFSIAPEEFADQQTNITVNGVKTYDEIVALWNSGRHYKSDYVSSYDPAPHWYFDLPLLFSNGKRNYKGFVSLEIDESGENQVSFNLQKRETEFIPLTDAHKYSLIIGQISGSGNKAVMYQYLKGLAPKAEKVPTAAAQEGGPDTDTAAINGETAKIIRNKESVRLQLIFEGKPSEETRSILKSNGFRWAPSNSAWQRLLNGNAEFALRHMTKEKAEG